MLSRTVLRRKHDGVIIDYTVQRHATQKVIASPQTTKVLWIFIMHTDETVSIFFNAFGPDSASQMPKSILGDRQVSLDKIGYSRNIHWKAEMLIQSTVFRVPGSHIS